MFFFSQKYIYTNVHDSMTLKQQCNGIENMLQPAVFGLQGFRNLFLFGLICFLYIYLNRNIISTRFQLIRDSFYHFDWKNVFKDNAVKKSLCMGQSFMIINKKKLPLKTLSIVLLYFEIRNSLLLTL
jgi:hypothetical protein